MSLLPTPDVGRTVAEAFVAMHLGHLVCDDVAGSVEFSGGQRAADTALAAFDVSGYARNRSEVLPVARRGASALSPYIRHGLLTLPQVWQHVAGGPERDVKKFRDELLWQEFARHWYSRLGSKTRSGVRNALPPTTASDVATGWDRRMACMNNTIGELTADGWLVNQTRMWLSSHWSVRNGMAWQDGEDYFFQHLLDLGQPIVSDGSGQPARGRRSITGSAVTKLRSARRCSATCARSSSGVQSPTGRRTHRSIRSRSL